MRSWSRDSLRLLAVCGHVVVLMALVSLTPAHAETGSPVPAENESWPLVWLDEDGDCRDTEIEVLLSQAINLVSWADPQACEIKDGLWQSWGNGAEVGFRRTWVVPLIQPQLAISRGASLWNREQQIRFLNDRENLILLDPESARDRGFKDITQWQPAEIFACEYARRYRSVSKRFGLSIPETSERALKVFEGTCGKAGKPITPYLELLEKQKVK